VAQNSKSHDAPWLTNSQTEMYSVYAGNARSSCLVVDAVATCSTRGFAALKLRSPKLLRVRGTKHVHNNTYLCGSSRGSLRFYQYFFSAEGFGVLRKVAEGFHF